MKKLTLSILSLIFLLCAAVGLVGCGKEKHTHSFTEQKVEQQYLASAATCTEAAKYYYSCSCGEKGTETFASGNALGHSFTNYVSDDNATCTQDGTKTATCDRCTEKDTIADENSRLPHTFDKQVTTEKYLASAATCTESAKFYYSCSCGEKGTETFASGNALGHSFTNYVSDNNATCTQDGTKTAKCDRCKVVDTITDAGSKLPHTFDKQVTTEKYLALLATCTEPAKYYYSCACGEKGTETFTYGNAKNHDYGTPVYVWSSDYSTCSATRVCRNDGNHVETEAATATVTVIRQKSCVLDELSTFTATFENSAFTIQTQENVKTADKLGHDLTHHAAKAATCTESGWNAYDTCTRCDYTTYAEISALGHDYATGWTIDIQPTCTETGEKSRHCTRCNSRSNITEIEKLGHSFTNYVSDNNATCTQDGTKTAICDRNGCNVKSTVTDEGSAKGHTYSEEWTQSETEHWHVATCGHNVEKDRAKHIFDENKKCTVCDYITVKPLGLELQSSVFDINVAAKTAYLKVANAVEDYDFSDKFAVADGARFDVCTDKQCNNKIASKKADIFAGDNVFYILVTNGNDVASYTLTLRRRQIYTVTFDTNGGSAVESQQVEEDNFAAEPVTTRKGYTFAEWDYDFKSPVIKDETITASWNIIEYNIVYDLNIPENSASKNVDNSKNPTSYTVEQRITFLSLTRTGYTFAGWSVSKIEKGTTGTIMTVANWTAVNYNIVYDFGDAASASKAKNNELNPATYTIEDEINTFGEPTRKGYTFVAWDRGIEKGTTGTQTITASWNIIEYNIVYDLNIPENSASKNVDNSKNPTTYTVEQRITFLSLTRTGYTFSGWSVSKIEKGTTETIKTVAKWTAVNYNIVYDFGDAASVSKAKNNELNPATYTIEDEISTLGEPTRKGYTFVAWDRGIEKGTTGTQTITASWNIIEYNIVYDLNISADSASKEVNNTANPTIYTVEDQVAFTGLTRAGYTFNGWSVTKIEKGTTGTITTVAKWTAVKYKIVYNFSDSNSVSKAKNNEVNPATYTIEDEITLKEPTRKGYEFTAWSVPKIANGTTGTQTITASWNVIEYNIIYDFNISKDSASKEADNTKNRTTYTVEDEISFAALTRTGYTFRGWSVSKIEKGTTGTITTVANWNAVKYKIVYNFSDSNSVSKAINNELNPATYTVEDEIKTLGEPTRKGYTFVAWDREIEKGTTGTQTITASWNVIEYNIVYDLNIPENSASKEADNTKNRTTYTVEDEISFAPATRTGYTFSGWSIAKIEKGTTGTITTVANWNAVNYNIVYDFSDSDSVSKATNNELNPATYTVEDALSFATPTRNGYTFVAWNRGIEKGATGTQTITASWNVIEYNILYVLDGGENAADNPTSYTIEQTIILKDPKKIGYSFSAWTDNGKIKRGTIGDITFTATYTPDVELSDDGSTVTGLKNTSIEDLVILSEYNGVQVTSIGEYAFYSRSGLTSVTIPDSVTSIGSSAFEDCSGLTSVTMPDSVTSIGRSAFEDCSGLTSVTIGKGVTSIGEDAFRGCSGLTSVTIGNGVTSIGGGAFAYCRGLTSVTIGKGVTSIGYSAFEGCSKLTSITIPNSVTSIGNSAFRSCSGLTSVVWNAENCRSAGSSNYHIFKNCNKLTQVTIGENVKTIPSYAFSGCSGLTSIVIPDSVTSIGGYAFSGCYKLVEVINNSSLNITKGNEDNGYVAYYAINVKKDGSSDIVNQNGYMFYTCEGVNYLFGYVGAETELVLPENYNGQNYKIYSCALRGCSGLTSVTIPDSVTSIGDAAFSYCGEIASVTIPNGVTSIGGSAFYGCSGLTEVIWNAENCTTAGSSDYPIFEKCNKLTQVTIGENVKTIPSCAFYGCSGLTNITIPDSVTSIGDAAFRGCSGLTNVTISAKVTGIGNFVFYNCSGLASITIPDSVTYINYAAFYNCSKLTSITIPNSVTSIDRFAFEDCTGLTSIIIPNSVTYIGYCAFSGCGGLTEVIWNAENCTSAGSPNYPVFKNCNNLTQATIGANVKTVPSYAFYDCTGLTSVTIPDSVTSIGAAFYGCTGLTEIHFTGTKEQWNAISKESDWDYNTGNYTIYCTDGTISK